MKSYFKTIESHLKDIDIVNPKVSSSSIGWQIDHSLKVINSIYNALAASNPSDTKKTLTFIGRILLMLNYIPRGKGKSPKHVLPPEMIKIDDLKKQLTQAKTNIAAIPQLNKEAHFLHPYFGTMRRDTALKFIKMHTKHHLKIVKDILKNDVP